MIFVPSESFGTLDGQTVSSYVAGLITPERREQLRLLYT